MLTTTGSNDISCPGLVTSSGNSSSSSGINPQSTNPGTTNTSHSHTAIIASVTAVAGIAVSLIGVALFVRIRRRQRRRKINRREQPGFVLDTWAAPTPYVPIETDMADSRTAPAGPNTANAAGLVYTPDYSFKMPPDRKSTRLNSSHSGESRMPSSA